MSSNNNTEEDGVQQRRKSDPRIDEFIEKFERFLEDYRLDMHGDTNAENGGRHGVVDLVRELRRYPSLTWLLAHKPFQTIPTLLAAFMITNMIYDFAPHIFKAILIYFGVHIP